MASFARGLARLDACVRCGLSLAHVRSYRRLSKSITGLRQWQEARAQSNEDVQLESLCNDLIKRVETDRYIKCSQVTKVFDHCMNKEDLQLAEKLLVKFRHSLSQPRPSLPLVVVRACVRVGQPRRALHYARNKVHFGLFPTPRVYKILIEALLLEGNAPGAVAAYQLLLADEIEPDGMTYYLAAISHARLGTAEGSAAALELCEKCRALEPRLGAKAYQRLVARLLKKERTAEEGRQLLAQLEQKGLTFPKQFYNPRTQQSH